jgi:hypothetical protein
MPVRKRSRVFSEKPSVGLKHTGPDSNDVALTAYERRLARRHRRAVEASALYGRVLSIQRLNLGNFHPTVAATLHDLARTGELLLPRVTVVVEFSCIMEGSEHAADREGSTRPVQARP